MQIVRGISNVFVVQALTRTKNTTITFNNGTMTPTGNNTTTRSIYPGQSIQMTIYHPNPPTGSKIVTAFIKAQDKVNVYLNGTKKWIAMSTNNHTWDSTTTTTTTTNLTITSARFSTIDSGYYKVVVQAGGIVIAVSKPILVKQPFIQIPFPKTTYYQWEPIPFQNYINIPYFTPSVYEDDCSYYYEIVALNYTIPIDTSRSELYPQQFGLSIYNNDVYNKNRNVNTLPPGLYNIRLFVHRSTWYDDHFYERFTLEKVVPIKNTTFRVLQNDGLFTINNYKSLYKYNDFIDYTFTTAEKVMLGGHIELYASLSKYNTSIRTIDLNSYGSTNNRTTFHGKIKIESPYSNNTLVLDQKTKPEYCSRTWE